MTAIAALVTGALFRAPESRTSKSGKPFVTATIRAKDDDAMLFMRLVAFNEAARAELLRLKEGDSVAIQGPLQAELYRPEGGEPKLSLSMIANHVLALRQPPRESKAAGLPPPAAGPNDDIPFGEGGL
jgi:single-stranded DNA-binding protein